MADKQKETPVSDSNEEFKAMLVSGLKWLVALFKALFILTPPPIFTFYVFLHYISLNAETTRDTIGGIGITFILSTFVWAVFITVLHELRKEQDK